MNITLDSNPSDAPGCVKIIADDGRDMLVQLDYDWPAIAGVFGWTPRHEPNEPSNFKGEAGEACIGSYRTDGTIDCPECGKSVSEFISEAREYLDDNDGSETEDPGYFDN